MTPRPLRLLLAASLLWTGLNICRMPQAQCEDEQTPACGCEHGQKAKCCSGVHLVEAGTGSVSLPAAPADRQALVQPAPEPSLAEHFGGPSVITDAPPFPRPPPRGSLGRAPPAA
jgi:hypothetical protein